MKNPPVILIFALLMILSWNFIDRPIALYFHPLDLQKKFPFLVVFYFIGLWKYYLCLFILLALYFRFVRPNRLNEGRVWYLFFCLALTSVLNGIIKIVFARARPELLFINQSYGFYWLKLPDAYHSFVSGHAVTTTTLAAALGVLFPRYFIVFIVVALLVCASRVVLLNHYLSDVLIGFYFSILAVGLTTQYFKRKKCLEQS